MTQNNNIRVLFVDDDITLGALVTSWLNQSGYSIHFQSSSAGLESVILDFKPHIIFFDIELGNEDGVEVAKRVSKQYNNIPFIFVSSHIDNDYIQRAMESGGVTFLKKPLLQMELITHIKRYAQFQKRNVIELMPKNLTQRELKLFELLYENRGKLVSKSEISCALQSGLRPCSDDVIRSTIKRLRMQLAGSTPFRIINYPTRGYMLVE